MTFYRQAIAAAREFLIRDASDDLFAFRMAPHCEFVRLVSGRYDDAEIIRRADQWLWQRRVVRRAGVRATYRLPGSMLRGWVIGAGWPTPE